MRIEKSELSQKINRLKQVVPKKTPCVALQGILVSDGYFIASNTDISIKTKVEGTEGESFIIPAKAFDLISNLPDGEVEIISDHSGETFGITVVADRIKNRYQTVNPSLFPVPKEIKEGDGEFRIRAHSLLTSMKRVLYAVLQDGEGGKMNAMCLQAANGELNLVGLDGKMIAWDKVNFDGNFTILVPWKSIEKLLAIGIVGTVTVRYNETGVVFASDECELYSRLIDGDYYNYVSMFRELQVSTVVNRQDLLDAMVRVKMCTQEAPARIELEGFDLNIAIKDSTVDYHETVSLQEEVKSGMTIGFNAKLIIETLKAFDCENVAINFENPKMPMIIEAEDSDFKALVLPVALTA